MVINRIKEFLDIAFQNKTGVCSVLMNPPRHFLQNRNTPMRAVANPARKGSGNESFFENRIDNRKYGMMQNPIPNQSFMDVPLLRIMDVKADIWSVLIGFIAQFATKLKYILFEMPFESPHITFISFVAFESVPC